MKKQVRCSPDRTWLLAQGDYRILESSSAQLCREAGWLRDQELPQGWMVSRQAQGGGGGEAESEEEPLLPLGWTLRRSKMKIILLKKLVEAITAHILLSQENVMSVNIC